MLILWDCVGIMGVWRAVSEAACGPQMLRLKTTTFANSMAYQGDHNMPLGCLDVL
jgi:hypothetical protein